MAVRHQLVETLLTEARQELARVDAERNKLIELINDLMKYLPTQVETEVTVSGGVAPVRHAQTTPPPMALSSGRVIRFTRKTSHAKRIAEILAQPGRTMKLSEIVAKYQERGFSLTKNATDILRTAVRNRKDLFDYKRGGYVTLKDQQ